MDNKSHDKFALEAFLPYRLSILSQSISGLIAREYESKFGITMNQWRCLVIIAANEPITAQHISAHALLDKMTISRALKSLEKRKLIRIHDARNDARTRPVCLTKTGRDIYQSVIPIAQNYEHQLKNALTAKQATDLDNSIDRLLMAAQKIDHPQAR